MAVSTTSPTPRGSSGSDGAPTTGAGRAGACPGEGPDEEPTEEPDENVGAPASSGPSGCSGATGGGGPGSLAAIYLPDVNRLFALIGSNCACRSQITRFGGGMDTAKAGGPALPGAHLRLVGRLEDVIERRQPVHTREIRCRDLPEGQGMPGVGGDRGSQRVVGEAEVQPGEVGHGLGEGHAGEVLDRGGGVLLDLGRRALHQVVGGHL